MWAWRSVYGSRGIVRVGLVRSSGRSAIRRDPLEDVEIAANVVDVAHGFPAARIAACSLRVPELLRQQRQEGAYVLPRVGITMVQLREDTRILEMAVADIVGGEGKPGPVRLGNACRDPC